MHVCDRMCLYVHVFMCVCARVCVHVRACMCPCVRACACMHGCVCVCVCVCVSVTCVSFDHAATSQHCNCSIADAYGAIAATSANVDIYSLDTTYNQCPGLGGTHYHYTAGSIAASFATTSRSYSLSSILSFPPKAC